MGLQSGVLAAVSLVLWPIGDDKQLVGEGLGSLYRAGVNGGSAPLLSVKNYVCTLHIYPSDTDGKR